MMGEGFIIFNLFSNQVYVVDILFLRMVCICVVFVILWDILSKSVEFFHKFLAESVVNDLCGIAVACIFASAF